MIKLFKTITAVAFAATLLGACTTTTRLPPPTYAAPTAADTEETNRVLNQVMRTQEGAKPYYQSEAIIRNGRVVGYVERAGSVLGTPPTTSLFGARPAQPSGYYGPGYYSPGYYSPPTHDGPPCYNCALGTGYSYNYRNPYWRIYRP